MGRRVASATTILRLGLTELKEALACQGIDVGGSTQAPDWTVSEYYLDTKWKMFKLGPLQKTCMTSSTKTSVS